tara:strand:+ start:1001 stop:1525 length:525 start_codon:yes stop_codon:yes gene_type:complete
MAQTDIHGLSVQEKLNTRDLDVITVTLTTDAETIGDNKVFAQAIEIPFATSVTGGSGLIKSITILDQTTTSPAMDIVFSSVNTSITQDEGKAVGEDVADLDSALVNMLGVVKIVAGDYTDLADSSLASKTGIDLGIHSAAASSSIYASAINRSGSNYVASATTVLRMKVTIQKD